MINYAVIGCGGISKVHCAAIQLQKDSFLHTVCDIVPEKADQRAAEFNCSASYLYDEILGNSEIDVVTICLPHHEHYSLFKKALSGGKHVISEKPLAINMEDLEDMVELSETTTIKTTVAFQHRHSLLVKALKTHIDNGLIGNIEKVDVNFFCRRDMDYYDADEWRGKWATEGGGTMINQAIHSIDLANIFLGEPIHITGRTENRFHSQIEVEDFGEGIVFYNDNRVLNLKAINSHEKDWEPKLTIYGTEGFVTLLGSDVLLDFEIYNGDKSAIKAELKEIEELMQKDKTLPGKSCYGDLHERVFDDFTQAIIEDRKPYLSVKDAAMANKIVLEFYDNFRGER